MADQVDLDALGAQYREARDAIGVHRQRQARAELDLTHTRRRYPENSPEVTAALAKVERAVADVEWCKAVTVAAGEAYKGVPFDDVPTDRSVLSATPEEILARIDTEESG